MRLFAFIFGLIFLVVGIGGFVPHLVTDDHLAGVFRVNAALNILHIVSGILCFIVGFISLRATLHFFRFLGVFYGIFAVLGFIYEDHEIFHIFASGNSDTWLHVVIAIAALVLGFGTKD